MICCEGDILGFRGGGGRCGFIWGFLEGRLLYVGETGFMAF